MNLLAATACTSLFLQPDGSVNYDRLFTVISWVSTTASHITRSNADTDGREQVFLLVAESIDAVIEKDAYEPEILRSTIHNYVEDRNYGDHILLVDDALNSILLVYSNFYDENIDGSDDVRFYVYSKFLEGIQTGIRNALIEQPVGSYPEFPSTLRVIE
ncbi:MAG: hypothetical protein LAT55_13765 [Opitutales bacterium]|nr:hypothetical protein [Opitutales bacterium]